MLLGEGAERRLEAGVEQIGHHEYDAALLGDVPEEVGGPGDVGPRPLRLGVEQLADHMEHVVTAAARRDELLQLVREEEQGDAVVIAHRRDRQERAHVRRELPLALPDGAEPRRGRHVHGEVHVQRTLLPVLLDVRDAHAGGDVPVDAADVVAGLVLAHLLEVETRPLEHAAVGAEQELVGEHARLDLDLADLPKDLFGDGSCRRLRGRAHGSGTLSSTRWMIVSAVISSASAW